MDEYNINNIQKINSINFINISDDKMPSRAQKPFYKLKQIEYLNPIKHLENSYTIQKGEYSQRNLSKITPLNKKYITHVLIPTQIIINIFYRLLLIKFKLNNNTRIRYTFLFIFIIHTFININIINYLNNFIYIIFSFT